MRLRSLNGWYGKDKNQIVPIGNSLKTSKVKRMKLVAIYDNEGNTLDRYTFVVNNRVSQKHRGRYTYDAISASEHGLGVFMWVQCIRGPHLGKRVEFSSLSEELQDKVKKALE